MEHAATQSPTLGAAGSGRPRMAQVGRDEDETPRVRAAAAAATTAAAGTLEQHVYRRRELKPGTYIDIGTE